MKSKPQVNISFVDPETIDESSSLSPSYETQLATRGRIVSIGLLLVLLVFAVFGIALRGEFLFLDDRNVSANLALRTWGKGFVAIWAHPTIWPQYEPVWYSALMLQYKIFGSKLAGGYIAVSILLHSLNTILLWTLLRKLELPGALVAAALFAVHPVNVEAVAWVSQQSIVMCGTFSLLAMLVFLRHRGINPAPIGMRGWLGLPESNWALMLWSILLLVLAVGSHPMGTFVPLIIVATLWWERGRLTRDDWKSIWPLLVIGIGWGMLLIVEDARRNAAAESSGILATLLNSAIAAWTYLAHVAAPFMLSFGYINRLATYPAIQWIALVAILVAIGSLWMIRPRFGRAPMAAGGIFLLAILPGFLFTNSSAASKAFVSDHLAYFASMIFATALVATLAPIISRFNRAAINYATPALAIVVYGIFSIIHLTDYQSSDALWAAALRANPDSILAHNQLGLIELNERKNNALAMVHFRAALEKSKEDVGTLRNIAEAYAAGGELDKARACYQQAVVIAPNDAAAHFGLAAILSRQNQSESAMREYQASLRIDSTNPVAHANLGLVYAERGEFESAERSYEEAIRLNPSLTFAYLNFANLLFDRFSNGGDEANLRKAVKMLESVIALDPGNYVAYLNAGAMAARLAQVSAGDGSERKALLGQAALFVRKAVSLQPKSADTHAKLAAVLMLQDRLDDAVFEWTKASELAPEDAGIQRSLENARRAAAAARSADGQ